MGITMESPVRAWILEAYGNDKTALLEGVMTLFNCHEAAISLETGDIWIANPQRGHWLDADGLDQVGRALKAGDI